MHPRRRTVSRNVALWWRLMMRRGSSNVSFKVCECSFMAGVEWPRSAHQRSALRMRHELPSCCTVVLRANCVTFQPTMCVIPRRTRKAEGVVRAAASCTPIVCAHKPHQHSACSDHRVKPLLRWVGTGCCRRSARAAAEVAKWTGRIWCPGVRAPRCCPACCPMQSATGSSMTCSRGCAALFIAQSHVCSPQVLGV